MGPAKRVLHYVGYCTGLISLHNKLYPRRKVVILCAHEGRLLPRYINYLYKTCKIISLDDFLEIHRNNAAIPENAVVLTFDDGYRSNYTEVYHILKRYKMPATIFLTVNMIGTEKVFCSSKVRFAITNTKKQFVQMDAKRWKLTTPSNRERVVQELCKLLKGMPEQTRNHKVDELITSLDVKVDGKKLPQMLTWEQVKEMSDSGITFGAHSLNHPMLTRISLEDARKEIADSKRVLEEKIQKPVKYFAYPYGTETDYNEDIKNIVRESGYTCALTFMGGYNDQNSDIFTLRRMALYTNKPDLAFALSNLRWRFCPAQETISNKDVYEASDIVQDYSILDRLQKPENTILSILRNELKNMKMLDIGVGGGRTTVHFADLVEEYLGVDYSENMINACKRRFSASPPHISFKVCDVRYMKTCKDNYFDFILFSFNGIDYISHEDRLKALQEIRRVGKSGGFFCFSTHNLQNIDRLFSLLSIQLSINPITMSKKLLRYLLLRLLNQSPKKLKNERYAVIKDGAYRFRLASYYIKPEEQIKQLEGLGFRKIRVFSLADGKEIIDKSNLDKVTERYLYYLCNI